MDIYRTASRGQYDNDFSFMNYNSSFPSNEVKARTAVYKFRHKQYTGLYSKNKRLLAVVNGAEMAIPYKTISLNYFKLLSNKMTDLIFNNEITVKTGDIQRDKLIDSLLEKTCWRNSIRKAFKICTEYGDACIKTYKDGVSSFEPTNCFKVVDEHDISNILGYCSFEYLYTKYMGIKQLSHIRFEINIKGKVFEQVCIYTGNMYGGTVGMSVEYKYKNRVIPAGGVMYDTGIEDCELVQWLSTNQESDGVYGESIYQDIQDIVFAMEQRLSAEHHTLNGLQNPFLIVGMEMVEQDRTGRYHLKVIDDNLMISAGQEGTDPKFITPDYKLENSEKMLDILGSFFYELSEMGKTYLSGEYGGNISEETLNNTIKSAIDKGNRLITEMYYSFRDSLYCLCKLNGINVLKDDITICFNIGRTDDDMKIMEISEKAIANKILSKATIREKYFGYNKEQSDEEDKKIKEESEEANNVSDIDLESNEQNDEINDEDKEIINKEEENKNSELKEDKSYE